MKRVGVDVTTELYNRIKKYAESNPIYAGNISAAIREALAHFFAESVTPVLKKR